MTTISSRPADTKPPQNQTSPLTWVRKNLFNNIFNSILTIVLVIIIGLALRGLVLWIFQGAEWAVVTNNVSLFMTGLYPRDLYWRAWLMLGIVVALAGFTWGVVGRNLGSLFSRNVLMGLALAALLIMLLPITRPNAPRLIAYEALTVAMAWLGQQAGRKFSGLGMKLSIGWFASYFVLLYLLAGGDVRASVLYFVGMMAVSAIAGWQLAARVSLLPKLGLFEKILLFLVGFIATYLVLWYGSWLLGVEVGLDRASTSKWGGLMLTLLLAITGIALCFPVGLLMALGRRSQLPIVRGLSIAYIELIRGVPLISILFMGQVMIPLFLPEGTRPDRIVRAIVGLTIFSSAYLAENVRAGLQSIPRGQTEAAQSLGLNTPLTMSLIVLPQALKVAIPAIVGQFISLFQDTTLLGIVGLVELLGITQSILANPSYLGDYAEGYAFIAAIYWVFCYAMTYGSRRLETSLNNELR